MERKTTHLASRRCVFGSGAILEKNGGEGETYISRLSINQWPTTDRWCGLLLISATTPKSKSGRCARLGIPGNTRLPPVVSAVAGRVWIRSINLSQETVANGILSHISRCRTIIIVFSFFLYSRYYYYYYSYYYFEIYHTRFSRHRMLRARLAVRSVFFLQTLNTIIGVSVFFRISCALRNTFTSHPLRRSQIHLLSCLNESNHL